jgi:hypothetical protein
VCSELSLGAAVVPPRQPVTKSWRLRNTGTCAWPEGTRLMHVGAEPLGVSYDGVPVAVVQPGADVDVTLRMLAPPSPGRHVGYFRLTTPDGVRFGARVWADVYVDNSNAAQVFGPGGYGFPGAGVGVGVGVGVAAVAAAVPAVPTTVTAAAVAPTAVPTTVTAAAVAPTAAPVAVVSSAPAAAVGAGGVTVAVAAPESPSRITLASTGADVTAGDWVVVPALPTALPSVPSAPPAAVELRGSRFAAQLTLLQEMGMADRDTNLRVLECYDGDVQRSIEALLRM